MSDNDADGSTAGGIFVGGSTTGTIADAGLSTLVNADTTTWSIENTSRARLPKKLRATLVKVQAHLSVIEQYAPDGVLTGVNDAEAAEIIAEELVDAFEVLQEWMADQMRAAVKEGGSGS